MSRNTLGNSLVRLILMLGFMIAGMHIQTALADNQPPSIVNGIYATALSENSVRISWNKPWDDQGIKGYDIYRDTSYYNTVYETQMIDNGVAAGTAYNYQIVAFDFSNNYSSQSAIATVHTKGTAPLPPAPENAPSGTGNNAGSDRPLRPHGLWNQIIHGNSLRLYWTEPQSSTRITGYNIFRDGDYLTWVPGTSFTEDWVDWGRNYTYTVVAIDDIGSFSDPSDPHIANTYPQAGNNDSTGVSAPASPAPAPQPQSPQQPVVTQSQSSGSPPDSSRLTNDGVMHGARLVFAEEFQGYSLDTNKWNSSYRWGANWIINNERQYYVDHINKPYFGYNPFEFDGEHLTISAIRTPDWLRDAAINQPYLSGALTTFNKFSMKYGFIEMRAKLPRGRGLWSAFWLLHQNDNDQRPEIDVVEYLGHQPDLIYNTYHWHEGWNGRSIPSIETWGPDYSQDFHVYGVRWEPGLLEWYVDGEKRASLPDANVSWEDMYLLVNLAVGGWWPGDPDWATEFPARLTIDYIRAWQR